MSPARFSYAHAAATACLSCAAQTPSAAITPGGTTAIEAGAAVPEAMGSPSTATGAPSGPEAGFVDVPARTVTLHGRNVALGARARLFYNLWPADADAAHKPIIFLSNGFAAEIVRAYGTGPRTVVFGGDVVANATPLTRLANLVFLEPRQSGYSYDVVDGADGGAPRAEDCSADVFNEYVDAADYLLGALAVLDSHPALGGPLVWLGESYAGVRVTWVIAYLRGRFDLAPYDDPLLASHVAGAQERRSGRALYSGQVLLEGWLAGGPEEAAVTATCADATQTAAVAASLPSQSCGPLGACDCADSARRSRYDFAVSNATETSREDDASNAHVDPNGAAALLGVPLTSIAGLDLAHRAAGFKCSAPNERDPNETVVDESPLVAALGALPPGQRWYMNFTPLQPDTDTAAWTRDWATQPYEGLAFVDNVRDVPTFVTRGGHDLVVPFRALAPALSALIGADRVDASNGGLGIVYPDGERFLSVGVYPAAGHMITMLAAPELAADLAAWTPLR